MTDDEDGEWESEEGGTNDRFGDDEADPPETDDGDPLAGMGDGDPLAGTGDDVDDPFAELGEGGDESDPVDPEPKDPGSAGPEPARDDLSADPADDPFDELGPATADDAEDGLGDAFERMDVGEVAEEDVWESIDEDAAGDRFSPGAAERSDARSDEVEHVVDKRTYCQQCPHFSAPPDVACTHEGTTIVEAVDFDEFRVRNCPMVSEEDPTFDAEQ